MCTRTDSSVADGACVMAKLAAAEAAIRKSDERMDGLVSPERRINILDLNEKCACLPFIDIIVL